eukprot:TRINITY_DN6154_c0_g1_i1.p1 TRINITY_DN6154_c0_g1~~TRINITY_DN6154_c0_g1_i1.p1  ORF type:complete len:569 (-),score=53.60 TRINITY_DN6154_c0_g1_i1:537-2063(-)
MATGQVLFHRFYCKRSFRRFNVKRVAASSLWLACKLEESPRKIRDVLNVFYRMEKRHESSLLELLEPLSKQYDELKTDLIRTERHLLKEMGFVCHVEHPHKFILNYLSQLEVVDELKQDAWNLANDSLRTTLCVRFRSEVVACGVIYAAARRARIPLPENPPWWLCFDAQKDEIDEVCRVLANLYRRPKPQNIEVCKDGKSFVLSTRAWEPSPDSKDLTNILKEGKGTVHPLTSDSQEKAVIFKSDSLPNGLSAPSDAFNKVVMTANEEPNPKAEKNQSTETSAKISTELLSPPLVEESDKQGNGRIGIKPVYTSTEDMALSGPEAPRALNGAISAELQQVALSKVKSTKRLRDGMESGTVSSKPHNEELVEGNVKRTGESSRNIDDKRERKMEAVSRKRERKELGPDLEDRSRHRAAREKEREREKERDRLRVLDKDLSVCKDRVYPDDRSRSWTSYQHDREKSRDAGVLRVSDDFLQVSHLRTCGNFHLLEVDLLDSKRKQRVKGR